MLNEREKLEKILDDIQEKLTHYPSIVDDDPKQDRYYEVPIYLTKSEIQTLKNFIASQF